MALMTPASKSTFVLGHRHLLGIEGLSAADITGLLDLSEEYVELNRQVPFRQGFDLPMALVAVTRRCALHCQHCSEADTLS